MDWVELFILILSNLDHDTRLQECEKAKMSASNILQRFQLNLMEFGKMLRFLILINSTVIIFIIHPTDIQDRQPSL